MSKVTVVGAGNVGATCANVLVTRNVADEVVLIDIKEGLSGKGHGYHADSQSASCQHSHDRCDQ